MTPGLCTLPDDVLYLYQVLKKYLKEFQLLSGTVCVMKFTNRHDFMENVGGVTVLVPCTLPNEPTFVKVSQSLSELWIQTVGLTLGWLQFTNRHNPVKPRMEFGYWFLAHQQMLLKYLYQVSRKYLKGFKSD